ncbi:MAG TPA: S1 family peptidase, partial [Candidatus Brevibacterium intestinigallinarum]|nr:S1 family peptidase [Candidatus Brevibacterium intestinigallinarum]
MKTPQGGKRFVALSAAVAIGMGGVALTVPAMATNEAPKDLGQAVAAVAAADENILDKVAAIGYNADGEVTVQTVAGADVEADAEILEPVAALAEAEGQDEVHVTEIANGYSPAAATDVVGGAGYAVAPNGGAAQDINGLCSFGFPATGPNGEEAILTAGHCAETGASVFLETPSESNAGKNDPHGDAYVDIVKPEAIGSFTASEFGETILDPEDPTWNDASKYSPEDTQDFAVITLDDDTLTTHPEVTDWTTAGEDDLFASTQSVAGVHDVTSADVGKSMWRSGRTSGMQEGTIGSEDGGGYIGDIVDGYGLVGMPDSPDPNNPEIGLVYGFAAEALGIPGDSGGAVMMGDQAVGVTSLSNYDPATQEGDWIWVAELAKGLETVADGYTVKTTESTEEPTETAEPTPTETEAPEADAELAVDPQEITAERFIAEDEDQAIEDDRGVTYTVTDVEPGSEVTFDTYVEDQAANAGSGAAAPAAD